MPKTIPETIRAARIAAGLTQMQLGILAGYTGMTAQVQPAQWEAGTTPPPKNRLRAIAKALHIPVSKLIP